MARGKEIKVVGFVPDGNGGYRSVESMSPEERKEFGQLLTQRMGAALNDYFSAHPEEYAKI